MAARVVTRLPTLLQADPAGGAFGMQIVLFAIIFGIFYFIVFRPRRNAAEPRARRPGGDDRRHSRDHRRDSG